MSSTPDRKLINKRTLSARYRKRAAVLFAQDCTPQQVAERLGISVSVANKLKRELA